MMYNIFLQPGQHQSGHRQEKSLDRGNGSMATRLVEPGKQVKSALGRGENYLHKIWDVTYENKML